MITIKKYKDALRNLKTLDKQQEQQENIIGDEEKAIGDKYWELERKLRQKSDKLTSDKFKEVEGINNKLSKYVDKMSIEKQPYNDISNIATDIFKMFDIFLSEAKVPTIFDKFPLKEGRYLGVLKVLHDDKYKRVIVYFEKNNRPKNNITLKIKIESIFRYHFTEVNIFTRDIRYAQTVEELTEWFKKNENNLKLLKSWKCTEQLSDIVVELFRLEKLYEDVKLLWEKKSWRLVYWNYKKDYYENHYARGTETEKYMDVLEQLRILTKPLTNFG